MARLLPYYCELREKFNQDRFQGLTFHALHLFMLHFLRDRSIFAIFGLEDLYQAGTLTEVHFRDFDSWDWDYSMSKDLDCLDEIVNDFGERGELDDLDEPDEQDEEEPCHPVALMHEDVQFELRELVRRGDLEAVKRVLDMTPGIVHAWALCIAIETHRTDILCQLLEHGAQVDGTYLYEPLCNAAKYGNKDAVQLLLSRGANIEGGGSGHTPLVHAAREGHFEIVQYLVDEGANVNATWIKCPLLYAIENGHTRTVEYLLALGADVLKGRPPRDPPSYSSDPWPVENNPSCIQWLDSCWSDPSPWPIRAENPFSIRRLDRFWSDPPPQKNPFRILGPAHYFLTSDEFLVSSGVDVNSTEKESKATDLEDCPVVAAIQAQERRTILRRLFAKIASSLKKLLRAGASQGASTGLVNFAHKAGTETSRAIWRRGKRVIRDIGEGCRPSSLPEIVSILQVANAMRSAVPASDLVCSRKE